MSLLADLYPHKTEGSAAVEVLRSASEQASAKPECAPALSVFPRIIRPEFFFYAALALALMPAFRDITAPAAAVPAAAAVALRARTHPHDAFGALALDAKAALVFDGKRRETLFEKNAETPRPLASLTKVMTAATALSLVPETTRITIDGESLKQEGDTGLKPGESWLLRDLAKFTLIRSSNDGARAMAAAVGMSAAGVESPVEGRAFFIRVMNERAIAAGLTSARFQNETGLDLDAHTAGAVGSAKDMALLLDATLRRFPQIFQATSLDALPLMSGSGGHVARNTNKDADKFPLLLASKTGYTDLAGGNLLVAFDAGFNHPIIIVVLGSTVEGRFADAEKLLWATLKSLAGNK